MMLASIEGYQWMWCIAPLLCVIGFVLSLKRRNSRPYGNWAMATVLSILLFLITTTGIIDTAVRTY